MHLGAVGLSVPDLIASRAPSVYSGPFCGAGQQEGTAVPRQLSPVITSREQTALLSLVVEQVSCAQRMVEHVRVST